MALCDLRGTWLIGACLQQGWPGQQGPAASARCLRRQRPAACLCRACLATPTFLRAPASAAGGASGDADDFEHMLNEMEDYKAPADAGGDGGDSQSDAEPGGSSDAEGEAGAAAGKAAKRRRKRGAKLSVLEFQASREMAKQIAECSAEEQADWLWASYQQAAAVALERGGLTAAGMAPLPAEGSLEDRLKTLQPRTWQQEFCGRAAGGGGGQQQQQQQQQQRPAGSPSLLLVSPSAMGAVNLIKLCPQFNRSCRLGKLFAKHMKVAEQEEALRSQVGADY